jgi:hypothetical protein
MLNSGNIYLLKILGNTLCWKLCEDLLKQNTGITLVWALWEDLFTQNTGKHLCWTLWEDLFTQNTLCWTLGRFIYTNYWEIHYVEHWEIHSVEHCRKIYLHKVLGNTFMLNTVGRCIYTKYFMSSTVGRFIYTKYWEILYVEHCGKI